MIFLFRFDSTEHGMDFVLNEKIASDMYPFYEEMLKPIVHSTCQVLSRYKRFSKSNTIMTSTILDNNQLEVMLSEGLGDYIDAYTKHQVIFENAKLIADILIEVMDQRTLERK
ncbi:hypothetical protein [Bacillus sp. TL12]|uniref:hypothetical protein n=1 Tax=Bacillus sp. TL12 TaxID=2894756 RepID=UPI001F52140E|nr:hypothetical protein [Bacillus sp. TL12]MCI0768544.1 hypothetical protein [Bacillus sp. TL12]